MPTSSESVIAAASGSTASGTMSQASVTDDNIKEALAKLDPKNDEHWTADGKPAMAAVNALLTAEITRARLEEVVPNFVRPPSETPAVPTGGVLATGDGEMTASTLEGDAEAGQPGHLHSDGVYRSEPQSAEDVAADLAFLRKQFGWPTKDA